MGQFFSQKILWQKWIEKSYSSSLRRSRKLWRALELTLGGLETLAGWTRVRRVAKKLLAGFSLTAGKKL